MKPHVKRAIVRYILDNGGVSSSDDSFIDYCYAITGSKAVNGEGLTRRLLLALYRDGTLTRWESHKNYNGKNAMRMTQWYVYDVADKSAVQTLIDTFSFDDKQLVEYVMQYHEYQTARAMILIKSRAISRRIDRLTPIVDELKEAEKDTRFKKYEFAVKHVGTTYIPCDICGQETMTLDVSTRKCHTLTSFICQNCGVEFPNEQDPR